MDGRNTEPLVALVRASCPSCGDVELPGTALHARRCSTTGEGSYSFGCPECGTVVVKPADQRLLDLLVASGISLTDWSLPSELAEEHAGDPISYDDILAFHDLLGTDDWFAAVEELVARDERGHAA
ncbi:MAG TPA: hypothetical protein VHC63_13770 [Acidimicrobiales bacterium]|nr:hypothetical protein [Acidimicrobiales bacterium]